MLGVPADRPPMVDLLVDLISKVVEKDDCTTSSSASPGVLTALIGALVLGMAFSIL
jgi:hypothetical protein